MGGYADKLQKAAGSALRPGERFVAAIRTQPRGATMGTAVGGIIGHTVASRQAAKAQANQATGSTAASWPSGRFAVGLTDQRLLTFSYTAMGKPKDLTSEFPLSQIATVDVDKKLAANTVRFGFADGSAVEVECAKLEKVGDFVSAFQRVKAGTPA